MRASIGVSKWVGKLRLAVIVGIVWLGGPPGAQAMVTCGSQFTCYLADPTCPEQVNCGENPGCRLQSSGCRLDGPGPFCTEEALGELWCDWVPMS
jgi:hypothetical protein